MRLFPNRSGTPTRVAALTPGREATPRCEPGGRSLYRRVRRYAEGVIAVLTLDEPQSESDDLGPLFSSSAI